MKTSLTSKIAGASVGLLLAGFVSSSAIAGPGPQYWQSRAKAPAVEPAKPESAPTHACAGATVVPVTTMKPAQANGRGPLVAVQTGTKTVCHMCPVTTTVRTNSLPNGRGTWTTTEVTQTGVEHTCTNCTAVAMN
jgi:hypothetical protein